MNESANASVDLALKLLGWATGAAIRAQQERAEIRRIAEQVTGVTSADLDADDARFAKVYDFESSDDSLTQAWITTDAG